nr:hypothetical protein [Tanacetum cinerariifolium]
MSSPTHPTPSDVAKEYAFLSANILDYTSTLLNYFPATPRNISSDFLENSKNDEIPPIFLPFYNNAYLKDMQAFYLTFNSFKFMSSRTHPTPSDVDEEYAFLSVNILDYTSTLLNYFSATPGNISSDFLENSKNDEIPSVFLPFYNNPYLKDMQAFYAKESPIPPPDPITPLIILTPSIVKDT